MASVIIRCPCCGSDEDVDYFYKSSGEIVGCNNCVEMVDSSEFISEFEDDESWTEVDRAWDEGKEW